MTLLQTTQTAAPPTVRRIGAEDFFLLARTSGAYRPYWEVMRMLAVGQAWGTGQPGAMPESGILLMPLDADVSWAAALREWEGMPRHKGHFLTPPVGCGAHLPFLLEQTVRAARRRSPDTPVQAVAGFDWLLEERLPHYFRAGFVLRAVRPLAGLAPEALLQTADWCEPHMWMALSDATELSLLLAKGWAAVDCRDSERGCQLGMAPPEAMHW